MAISAGTAALVGSVAAPVIGGVLGNKSASSAASAANDATDAAIAEQRRQFDLSRNDILPSQVVSTEALYRFADLLGLGRPVTNQFTAGVPVTQPRATAAGTLPSAQAAPAPVQQIQYVGATPDRFIQNPLAAYSGDLVALVNPRDRALYRPAIGNKRPNNTTGQNITDAFYSTLFPRAGDKKNADSILGQQITAENIGRLNQGLQRLGIDLTPLIGSGATFRDILSNPTIRVAGSQGTPTVVPQQGQAGQASTPSSQLRQNPVNSTVRPDTVGSIFKLYADYVNRTGDFQTSAEQKTQRMQSFLRNNFETSPDFQYKKQETEKAANAALAARGLLNSGSALEELTKLSGDLASQEYNSYYDRMASALDYYTGQAEAEDARNYTRAAAEEGLLYGREKADEQNLFDRLTTLIGRTPDSSNLNSTTAANIGNLLTAKGENTANARLAGNTALGQGLSSGFANLSDYLTRDKTRFSNGTVVTWDR
jgi:hypothetical protein